MEVDSPGAGGTDREDEARTEPEVLSAQTELTETVWVFSCPPGVPVCFRAPHSVRTWGVKGLRCCSILLFWFGLLAESEGLTAPEDRCFGPELV